MSTKYSNIPDFISNGTTTRETPATEGGPVNTTDLIYQSIHVFIEGVEVPFTNMSISQVMGQAPTCEFEVPPMSGLMEITRFYQPKVHVFYTDVDTKIDYLLFWGHIAASAYSRSRASANVAVHFRCNHRTQVIRDIILNFGGVFKNSTSATTQTTNSSTVVNSFSAIDSMIQGLAGITGVQEDAKDIIDPANTKLEEADVTKLDQDFKDFEKRLTGMAGVIVNLWNQFKKGICQQPYYHLNMMALYIPLFEQGISYFKRLSGHYYLEKQQQDSKVEYCPDQGIATKVMIPPAFKTGLMSSVQAEMAAQAGLAGVGYTGEMTGFLEMCENFFSSIEYDMLTLASPAEVPLDPESTDSSGEVCAVETIVRPRVPFYYSPVCNVIFPKMFDTINIVQDEEAIPTRVTAFHEMLAGNSNRFTVNYRGPNSVREALSLSGMLQGTGGAGKYDLRTTTGDDTNIPGKYEQGRGIRPMKITLPWWLCMLARNQVEAAGTTNQEQGPTQGSTEYNNMLLQIKDWQDKYGSTITENDGVLTRTHNPDKDRMNPYGLKTDIQPHERILFTATDYEYAKAVAAARHGSVECVFNPYIVPGYPMDVIDDSPNHPCFHGMCVAVTHSFSSRSIGTSVSMTNATTYEELSNYFQPPLHPWLQTALGMVNQASGEGVTTSQDAGPPQYGDVSTLSETNSTIIQNPNAKLVADEFYMSVLGVGAADPSELVDFQTGQAIPQGFQFNGIFEIGDNTPQPDSNGGDLNNWNTTAGNLRLVARPIESKGSIASKFQYDFVDFTEENYSGSTVGYSNPVAASSFQLEPGASMFLDYMETEDFLKAAKAAGG
jgi:hypothetical protein